jgi:glc operon protein GlcG
MTMAAELTRNVRTLTVAGARIALEAAERFATAQGVPLSLAVVDVHGDLVAFVRQDGAGVGTVMASQKKARTAATLGAPSKVFEDVLNGGNMALLAFDSVTPAQGGVPVVAGGVTVGAVGGSGGSGEEDEAAAKAGAEALMAALKG